MVKNGVVAKSGFFTIYGRGVLTVHTIYCLKMPFCNSPLFFFFFVKVVVDRKGVEKQVKIMV